MNKTKHHGIINLIFIFCGTGIGFLNTVLKAKALTPEEIGVIAILNTIATLAGYLINFGLPYGLRKFYSRFSDNANKKTAFIILCFVIPFTMFFLCSFLFSIFQKNITAIYDNELINQYIYYIYFFFIGNLFSKFFMAILELEYKSVLANIINNLMWHLLFLSFLTYMLFFQVPFFNYFIFTIIAIIFRVIIFFIYFLKKVKIARPDFKIFTNEFTKKLSKYCFFMFFTGVSGVITTMIDKLMIGYFITISDVGIYTMAMSFAILIRIIGHSFDKTANPLIAEYWNKNNLDGIKKIYVEITNIQIFFGAFVFLIILIFPEQLLNILGKIYISGISVLIFISAGELISLGAGVAGIIIAYSKYYKFDFILRIILVFIVIITNLIFIPIWGINGAALATALSLAIYQIIKMLFVFYKFKIQPYNIDTIKTIILTIITGSIFYWIISIFNSFDSIWFVLLYSIIFFIVYIIIANSILHIQFIKNDITKLKKYILQKIKNKKAK